MSKGCAITETKRIGHLGSMKPFSEGEPGFLEVAHTAICVDSNKSVDWVFRIPINYFVFFAVTCWYTFQNQHLLFTRIKVER